MSKRILITGSGGFVGNNLKSYFKDKYELLTPRSFELNLTDKKSVEVYFQKNNIDFVIHCASTGGARGVDDAADTIENNMAMVDNILEAKRKDVRVILFGSGAMYGKDRNLHKVKESEIGTYEPKDLYGKSKLLIAKMIKSRLDVLMLNIFACYGYGELSSRFPSYAVNQVLLGEDIIINQNVVFDYLFIEDLQRIVEYFIENIPDCNIMNVTPNESTTLLDIANIVRGFSSAQSGIGVVSNKMNNEYTGDNELLKRNVGRFNFTKLEVGLKKLYDYNKRVMDYEKQYI